jgi:hypothetical protein
MNSLWKQPEGRVEMLHVLAGFSQTEFKSCNEYFQLWFNFLPISTLYFSILLHPVFEKRVLRTIFGPKRDEVTGDWRKLHNEGLHNLYSSPNIITYNDQVKEDEMGRACSTNGENWNAYRILVGKPEGKRPLGRPRRRWVYNIKIDLSETGWDDVDWIHLAQDRDQWRAFVNTVMNLWVP